MSRESNTPLLLALVVCIMVVAGVMIAAVFLAGQKQTVVVVPPPTTPVAPMMPDAAVMPAALATSGAPAGSSAAAPSASVAPAPAAAPEVLVMRVPAVPPLDNVFAAGWERIPSIEIPLIPQQTTTPMLETATISSISVQAARDDQRIAWRLSWAAPKPMTRSETNEFPDAVALQFPLVDGAPYTMGATGQPVSLLHWKAVWQKDFDDGFQDVTALYPNAWTDMYWFAPHQGPVPTVELVKEPRALQFMPLHAAGNAMAIVDRAQPVEELIAEGFGTATTVPNSPSGARGVWRDGRWTVVIDRPWDSANDPLIARLQSATSNMISLAVWDGSAGNRGGRKHHCAWVPMKVEP